MSVFPMEVVAARLAEEAEPDSKAAYNAALASDALADPFGQKITVTILGLNGEPLLGPEPVDKRTFIGDFRVRLHAMMIQDYHEEEHYPWQTGLRAEVSIMYNGEPLADEVQPRSLVGAEDDAELQLDAALGEVETQQNGPTVEEIIEKLEVAQHGAELIGLYVHGSWVRRHKVPDDVDLLAVYQNPALGVGFTEELTIETRAVDGTQKYPPYNVACFTRDHWLRLLQEMDPTIILTLSLPSHFVFKDASLHYTAFGVNWSDFKVNLPVLKRSFQAAADGRWHSSTTTGFRSDDGQDSNGKTRPSGPKKIFCAFALLEYGTQLAEHGRVNDFGAANVWYARACEAQTIWDSLNVTGEKNEVYDHAHGWDAVHAAFGRAYQNQVDRFLAAVEAATPPELAKSAPELRQEDVSKCGSTALERKASFGPNRPAWSEATPTEVAASPEQDKDGSVANEPSKQSSLGNRRCGKCGKAGEGARCQLFNCSHAFHVRCILADIAKQDLHFDRNTRSGTADYPDAKCPVCDASVRIIFDAERTSARNKAIFGQPLVDGAQGLHFPYFDLCRGYVLYFHRWPTHINPYEEYEDYEDEVFRYAAGPHGEVHDVGDMEASDRKHCGRERVERKHKYQHKPEHWKGLKSGDGSGEEGEFEGSTGQRRHENQKYVARVRKHERVAAQKHGASHHGHHQQRVDRRNSANFAAKDAASSGGYPQ